MDLSSELRMAYLKFEFMCSEEQRCNCICIYF